MTNIPKITIIIPVFNEISTIEKVIERILKQKKIRKKQIIIVDDCSSDNTEEIVRSYEKREINIIYINNA
jgi:glycosyltransferase involved in cell wall biosynthesis